jgi:hypothetical protein
MAERGAGHRRLYDRMMDPRAKLALPPWADPQDLLRYAGLDLFNVMRSATVVVIDNVAEYLYAGTEQEDWHWQRDFPNLAPPFEVMWLEYVRPSTVRSKVYGETLPVHSTAKQTGVLWLSQPIEDEYGGGWLSTCFVFVFGLGAREAARQAGVPYNERVAILDQMILGPMVEAYFRIGEDGVLVHEPGYRMTAGWIDGRGDPASAEVRAEATRMGTPLYVPGLALSFMHCRNVETTLMEPDAKRQRQHAKKNPKAPPLVRYYTLAIDPMRRVLASHGAESGADGLARALHIVRGSFATYTEERPLFGRKGGFVGTVWRPQHLRGTETAGAVLKDYEVKV